MQHDEPLHAKLFETRIRIHVSKKGTLTLTRSTNHSLPVTDEISTHTTAQRHGLKALLNRLECSKRDGKISK